MNPFYEPLEPLSLLRAANLLGLLFTPMIDLVTFAPKRWINHSLTSFCIGHINRLFIFQSVIYQQYVQYSCVFFFLNFYDWVVKYFTYDIDPADNLFNSMCPGSNFWNVFKYFSLNNLNNDKSLLRYITRKNIIYDK